MAAVAEIRSVGGLVGALVTHSLSCLEEGLCVAASVVGMVLGGCTRAWFSKSLFLRRSFASHIAQLSELLAVPSQLALRDLKRLLRFSGLMIGIEVQLRGALASGE